jgi:hypothetical protein
MEMMEDSSCAKFDFIYATHMLTYLDGEQIAPFFEHARRVLKPGGKIYLAWVHDTMGEVPNTKLSTGLDGKFERALAKKQQKKLGLKSKGKKKGKIKERVETIFVDMEDSVTNYYSTKNFLSHIEGKKLPPNQKKQGGGGGSKGGAGVASAATGGKGEGVGVGYVARPGGGREWRGWEVTHKANFATAGTMVGSSVNEQVQLTKGVSQDIYDNKVVRPDANGMRMLGFYCAIAVATVAAEPDLDDTHETSKACVYELAFAEETEKHKKEKKAKLLACPGSSAR